MKAIVLAVTALAGLLAQAGEGHARTVTDGAGRRVEIPDTVTRVLAAGPPASVAIYSLAPDKLIGWIRDFSPAKRPFIAKPYVDLPAYGRLTGRGSTASTETVLALRPDLIVDFGVIDATYVSLADRIQRQTGIPYILIDGTFARTAEAYRALGTIIGAEPQAAILAAYAERTLADLKAKIAGIPRAQRPRVYYGRGPNGLETGLAGSINLEVLDAVGAINVAAAAGAGGLTTASMEQVLSWAPDVILTLDRNFYTSAPRDPVWQGVRAVRDGRIYRAPELPFGWFDAPPGANRLIGVRWLAAILYPDKGVADLRKETRDFYKLFYHVDVTDAQLDDLLKDAAPPPK